MGFDIWDSIWINAHLAALAVDQGKIAWIGARAGGGIVSTVRETRDASEMELIRASNVPGPLPCAVYS